MGLLAELTSFKKQNTVSSNTGSFTELRYSTKKKRSGGTPLLQLNMINLQLLS